MKKTLLLTTLLLLVLATTSCKKSPNNSTSDIVLNFETDQANLELSDRLPSALKLTFTTNTQWTALAICDELDPWLIVNPKQGEAGTNTITIVATRANELASPKEATIEISAGTKTIEMAILQRQQDMLIVGTKVIKCPSKGGIIIIELQRNADYTVTVPDQFANWISQPIKGKAMYAGSEKFTISATESEDQSREGFILFTVNNKVDTAYVQQENQIKSIHVTTPGTLQSLLTEQEQRELVKLKVTGVLNSNDFFSITSIATLNYLYLDDADVEVIPDNAFMFGSLSLISMPKKLKRIGEGAFQRNNIKSPILNEGLETIGKMAFYDCNGLRQINLPSSLRTIGESAFSAALLGGIDIPEGVVNIGPKAFAQCRFLAEVNISSTVRTMGKRAFFNCPDLKIVNISDGLTTIESSAFKDCATLSTVRLPNSLTSLKDTVFSNCRQLSTIVLPETLKTIGANTFTACASLAYIDLPIGLTDIGPGAFTYCNKLKTVIVPQNIKIIQEGTFSDCSILASVILPISLERIEKNAFNGCRSLASMTIPRSVISIGNGAFASTATLKEIILMSETPPTLPASQSDSQRPFGPLLQGRIFKVPAASLEAYKADAQWSYYASEIVAI